MNSGRHLSRQIAFQYLYLLDVAHERTSELQSVEQYFNHFLVPQDAREHAGRLIRGALASLTELDKTIEAHSDHWKITRMPLVDRNVLRLAVYEATIEKENPQRVVLDEAIELAKQYGSEDSPPFVNGVLDAICREGETSSTEESTPPLIASAS